MSLFPPIVYVVCRQFEERIQSGKRQTPRKAATPPRSIRLEPGRSAMKIANGPRTGESYLQRKLYHWPSTTQRSVYRLPDHRRRSFRHPRKHRGRMQHSRGASWPWSLLRPSPAPVGSRTGTAQNDQNGSSNKYYLYDIKVRTIIVPRYSWLFVISGRSKGLTTLETVLLGSPRVPKQSRRRVPEDSRHREKS